MARIAIGIEYDGTAREGWQSQPSGNTVQDQLETALAKIAGVPLRTSCAGRTDTGVHALEQIAHFDTPVARPLTAWVRGVNSHLPSDISVLWAKEVADIFHARYSARARHYRYLLLLRSVRPAVQQGRTGWYHGALDTCAMQMAANDLLGQHDFSSFQGSQCQAHSPVRTMLQATVHRQGNFLIFHFSANGFLQHMVRNLVGSLVEIGARKKDIDWLRILLAARDRKQAARAFPGSGLYFLGAEYDARWSLPQINKSNTTVFESLVSNDSALLQVVECRKIRQWGNVAPFVFDLAC